MFSFAQIPREQAIHFHTVFMVYIFIRQMKFFLHNMAHFYETPYLVECRYIFGLQTVYAIIQRIGAAKQAPRAIYLTVAGSFLQNQTFLIHSFVISYCTEEGISLQVFQCSQCGLHVILHHIRSILYRFYALLQDCVFIRNLSKSEFQEPVFLRVICSDAFFYTI